MSDQGKTYSVEFERRGKEIVLANGTFKELVEAVKREFQITCEVVLDAVRPDGSECEIWGDKFLEDFDNSTCKIVVHSNAQNPCAISFGTKEYSLDAIPQSDSILITIAKEVVIPEFNVPSFVENLKMFVSCVRLTHFHLLASGNNKLAMDLHKLGRAGLKPLSDKCTITLDLFTSTCRSILETFRTVFAHCLEGLEKQAIINLECLGRKASLMKDKTAEIIKDLEYQITNTEELLENTGHEWVHESNKVEEKDQEMDRTNEKLDDLHELNDIAQSTLNEAEMAGETYRTMTREINFLKYGFWCIRYAFNKTPQVGSDYYNWVRSWNHNVQAQEEAKEARSSLKTVAAEQKREEKKLQKTEKERNDLAKQGEYLAKGLEAIKNAYLTMQAMHTFWRKMEMAIAQLTDNEPFIECLKKSDNQVIKKLLRSRAFKRQGIIYMARCVAIRDISISCGKGMSTVKAGMEAFLRETPNKSEAQRMLEDEAFVRRLELNSGPVDPSATGTDIAGAITTEEREIRHSFQQPAENWLQFGLPVEVSN
ncbi:uncharacterized protein LOC135499876 isoform X2 [Lineus longissimus]|uniref:uncharacterized protein LOC135499876 isoform X2 n=1 Tax=Lineus longissimus TaxID=88925 RepID=UPI002B4E68A7